MVLEVLGEENDEERIGGARRRRAAARSFPRWGVAMDDRAHFLDAGIATGCHTDGRLPAILSVFSSREKPKIASRRNFGGNFVFRPPVRKPGEGSAFDEIGEGDRPEKKETDCDENTEENAHFGGTNSG